MKMLSFIELNKSKAPVSAVQTSKEPKFKIGTL